MCFLILDCNPGCNCFPLSSIKISFSNINLDLCLNDNSNKNMTKTKNIDFCIHFSNITLVNDIEAD